MPTNPPTITALPSPPDPNDRSSFNVRAYPWSVAQQTLATEVAAVAANVKENADEALAAAGVAGAKAAEALASEAAAAASAASALNAPGTTATSTSSLAVGAGLKSLALAQTGKAFAVGQRVVIARTSAASTVRMVGYLEAADPAAGTLVARVGPSDFLGSGTYTDWTVSIAGEGNNLVPLTPDDVGKFLGVVAGPGLGLVAMTGSGGGALSGSQTLTAGGSYAVSPTANGQFVTLPDATTIATGAATINLKNSGNFTLGVRSFAGTVLGFLQAGESALVGLAVNSSAGGVWVIDFPSVAVSRGQIPSTIGTLMGTVQVGAGDVYLMFGYSVAGLAISFNAQAIDTATGAFGPVATSLAANWPGRSTATVWSLEGFALGAATAVLDMVHISTYNDGESTTTQSGRSFAPVAIDGALNVIFGTGTGHTYSNNSGLYKFSRAILSATKFAQSHCEGNDTISYSSVVTLAGGNLTKTANVSTGGAYAVAATAAGDALLVPKVISGGTAIAYVLSAAGTLGPAASLSAITGHTQAFGPTASGHFAVVAGYPASSSAASMVKLSISGTTITVSGAVSYAPSARYENSGAALRNNTASWVADGDFVHIGDTSDYMNRAFFVRVDLSGSAPAVGAMLNVPVYVNLCLQPWLQADGRLINLYKKDGNDFYWLVFERASSNAYLGGAFVILKTTLAAGAFTLTGFKRRKFYTKDSPDGTFNNTFRLGDRLLLACRGFPYSNLGGSGRNLNGPANGFLIDGMNISSFPVPDELLECINFAGNANTSKAVGLYLPSVSGPAGLGAELFGVNR